MSEITRGAVLEVLVEYKVSKNEDLSEIQGYLHGQLEKGLYKMKIDGNVENVEEHSFISENMRISIEGSLRYPVIVQNVSLYKIFHI